MGSRGEVSARSGSGGDRLGDAGAQAGDQRFAFAIETFLDGLAARSAARTASSTDKRSTSGIESTGARIPVPSTRNNGQIRSSVVSTFSRTNRRAQSARRLRRGRLVSSSAVAVFAAVSAAGSAGAGAKRASIGRPYFRAMESLRVRDYF